MHGYLVSILENYLQKVQNLRFSVTKTAFDNAFRVIIKNGEYTLQFKKRELYLNKYNYQSDWVHAVYVHSVAILGFLHTLLKW